MDLYEYLISGAPKQAEIPAIVEQLRKRRGFGELGQLSGDKVLAPFGQGLVKQADSYAGQMQDTRQKDADNAQTAKYQTGQLDYQNQVLQATLARDRANAEHQRRADEAAMLRAQAAMRRAEAAGKSQTKTKLRQGDIKDLQDLSATVQGIARIQSQIEGGTSLGTKKIGDIPIPGSRVLANTMASVGMGSQKDKDSFALFQEWDRLYNLAERNRLFGATLSTNEQRAWRNANPSVLQTDEQILEALPIMQKVFETRLKNKMDGLTREGYNPEAIYAYAGMGSAEPDSAQGEMTEDGFPIAPPEAIAELMADPSPEALQEYIEVFGPTQVPAM